MKTLEQIIEKEKKIRCEGGDFGIIECKKSIQSRLEWDKNATLYTLLEYYVNRANTEVLFNDRMVLACWELINNK